MSAVPGEGWAAPFMFASTPAPVLPNLRLASGKPPLTKAAASNTEAEVFSDKPGLVYDERMMAHEDTTDPDHPEQPARISACFEELQRAGLVDGCKRFPVRNAMAFELESVHTPSWIQKATALGQEPIDTLVEEAERHDSIFLNTSTADCALMSAGATLEVTERVVRGECTNGVAIVRPPGHHAEAHCCKGFCFFNNVAVAAAVARKQWGVERVLIVDWDVHHGNGTQHMFENDPSVLYFSTHRYDRGKFYPHSTDASPEQIGAGKGAGYNVNVAWERHGMGDADYLHAWQRILIPGLY
mmetsp:Transcript_95036/g.271757  ORF Transcript_95036/g.271757 Transcript_95036/m.271757 type:complete len:299 (+) Transcript_95036:170-1066(+)